MPSESLHKWANTLGSIGTFVSSLVAVGVAFFAWNTARGKADVPKESSDPVLESLTSGSDAQPAGGNNSFGQWITVTGEQTASTDGFARASSQGNNAARGVQIQVYAEGGWKTVARSPTIYSTVIAPIAEGSRWRATAMDGGGKPGISWMPQQ